MDKSVFLRRKDLTRGGRGDSPWDLDPNFFNYSWDEKKRFPCMGNPAAFIFFKCSTNLRSLS